MKENIEAILMARAFLSDYGEVLWARSKEYGDHYSVKYHDVHKIIEKLYKLERELRERHD
jgi:hypothetical protein